MVGNNTAGVLSTFMGVGGWVFPSSSRVVRIGFWVSYIILECKSGLFSETKTEILSKDAALYNEHL